MTERMTAQAARDLLAAQAKRSKYGAKRTSLDGISFDSKAEADRYAALKLRERAGAITHLQLQPSYELKIAPDKPIKIRSKGNPGGRRIVYKADFRYFDVERGRVVVEDVKGQDTPLSRLKRAIVEVYYGVVVEIVR